MRAAIAIAFAPLLAASAPAAPAATPEPAEKPVFSLAVGANGALGGDEQSGFLPCGGGPSSFEVDGEGRWWILDAIRSRIVVADHDGSIAKTLPLPTAAKKAPYYADVAVDGAGGAFVLDATARRIVHVGADGAASSFGAEKIPRGKAPRLDLPKRIHLVDSALYVEDAGSDALLRFGADGAYRDAAQAPAAIPAKSGGLFAITQSGGATWLEAAPPAGHRRPVVKLSPAEGHELLDAWLAGATAAGEAVVVERESVSGKDDADRLRVLRIDAKGKIVAERVLAGADDGASPTRRIRLTPDGRLAWFQVDGGRFRAFEASW